MDAVMIPLCYHCELDVDHPWHDDGTQSPDIVKWRPGGEHAGPIHTDQKVKNR